MVAVSTNKRLLVVSIIEFCCLMLIFPFALFPNPVCFLTLGVIPLLWITRWMLTGHFIPQTPLDWVLLCLLSMVLVSIFVSDDLSWSLPKISGLIWGISFFYAIVQAARSSHRALMLGLGMFLLSGAGITFLGVFGANWQGGSVEFLTAVANQIPRFIEGLSGAGEGINPNQIAGALLWVLPMGIVLLFTLLLGRFITFRTGSTAVVIFSLLAVSVVIEVVTLVLTQSRSAWVGLGTVLFILIGIGVWYLGKSWAPARYLGFLAIVVIVSLGLLVSIREYRDRGDLSSIIDQIPGFEGRLTHWEHAIIGIKHYPLTGMGMNMYRRNIQVLYPLFRAGYSEVPHAHNEFLQAALDLGIPGLIAFVALYFGAFWMLVEIWTANKKLISTTSGKETGSVLQHWYRPLALGLGGGLLAHLLYSLTDAVALGAKPGFLFWMLLALISGLHAQTRVRAMSPIDIPIEQNPFSAQSKP